jgi:hypothetical protein
VDDDVLTYSTDHLETPRTRTANKGSRASALVRDLKAQSCDGDRRTLADTSSEEALDGAGPGRCRPAFALVTGLDGSLQPGCGTAGAVSSEWRTTPLRSW